MALKPYTGSLNPDENLRPWAWLNDDTQTHVWLSFLNTGIPEGPHKRAAPYPVNLFPQLVERHPKLTVKPGKVLMVPHRYYTCVTRDGSPAKGREMGMDESIENFSERSLTRGEEAHENRSEKKT